MKGAIARYSTLFTILELVLKFVAVSILHRSCNERFPTSTSWPPGFSGSCASA